MELGMIVAAIAAVSVLLIAVGIAVLAMGAGFMFIRKIVDIEV